MKKLSLKIALAVLQGSLLVSPFIASSGVFGESDDSCNNIRLNFGIDFIYWKPCVDDLDFALKSRDIVNPGLLEPLDPSNSPLVGKYRNLDPRGEGGVKAYLGKKDLWNGWDLFISYTYSASSACAHILQSPSGHVWPTLMHSEHTFAGNSVSSDYRLHYQACDVLLSNPIEWGSCGNLRPFLGFDSLYLFQELNSAATDVVDSQIGRSHWISNLCGIGMKIGFEYRLPITQGIGVYSKVSGSVLAAEDHARFKSVHETIEPGINLIVADGTLKFKSKDELIVPGYMLALGAYYKMDAEDLKVDLHIGYEFVQWFNCPNQRRYPLGGSGLAKHYSGSRACLGMHGVSVGFDVGF